jgi:hypothetical protein
MPGENLFEEALEESGISTSNTTAQTSDQEQESQTSQETLDSNEDSVSGTENTPSEMQGSVSNANDTEETNDSVENSTQEAGESEKKSSIIDLSTNEEASSQETTETTATNDPINFSEMFGEGYESVEDVKDHLEYAYELETKLEELENKQPEFANDFIKQMNEYALKGGDPIYFAKIQGMNVDELSAEEAIKLDLQQQYGLTEEEAKAHLNSKYTTPDFYGEDGEIDPKSINLKIDAKVAKERLKANQADNTLIEQKPIGMTEEEWTSKQQESFEETQRYDEVRMWDEKNGWAPEVDRVINDLKDKGITIDLGNGKAFNYVFNQDESYTENLISQVDQTLYDSGLSREENPQLAKEITENIYWLENKENILKTFGNEIRSMKDEEYFRLNNNPSAIQKGDPVDRSNNTLSAEEQMTKLWNL